MPKCIKHTCKDCIHFKICNDYVYLIGREDKVACSDYKSTEDVVPRSELETKAKQEVAREIFKQAFDYPTLADWYISSVDDRDTPVWTDEHIEELLNDFYVIPKEIADGYKV